MKDFEPNLDRTIVADDGRILLMSCQQFVSDICQGGTCFVCGAHPNAVEFNDEHVIGSAPIEQAKRANPDGDLV